MAVKKTDVKTDVSAMPMTDSQTVKSDDKKSVEQTLLNSLLSKISLDDFSVKSSVKKSDDKSSDKTDGKFYNLYSRLMIIKTDVNALAQWLTLHIHQGTDAQHKTDSLAIGNAYMADLHSHIHNVLIQLDVSRWTNKANHKARYPMSTADLTALLTAHYADKKE